VQRLWNAYRDSGFRGVLQQQLEELEQLSKHHMSLRSTLHHLYTSREKDRAFGGWKKPMSSAGLLPACWTRALTACARTQVCHTAEEVGLRSSVNRQQQVTGELGES
jgi:hypothetical protein